MKSLKKTIPSCPLTDLPVEIKLEAPERTEYQITVLDKTYDIVLLGSIDYWLNKKDELQQWNHIIIGLMANNKNPFEGQSLKDIQHLSDLVNNHFFPVTQNEKFDNLFTNILEYQEFDGQIIDRSIYDKEISYQKLFFKNPREKKFYLDSLLEEGLIEYQQGSFFYFFITFKGLRYIREKETKNLDSTNCFVVMSFHESMAPTREAIKEACRSTNYTPLLVDETNYDSDQTINEAMLLQIKTSKFCIVDFTQQRPNVYFEAGYAVGRGLKVIYCCQEEDYKNIHFDVKQFPCILYKNGADLKEKLITKISVWVEED